MPALNRRELLKRVVGASVVSTLGGCALDSQHKSEKVTSVPLNDLIRRENAKAGTQDWILENTRIDPVSKYRCPWIEGYCSRTSVSAGEEISFYVSTNPASPFRIDIYRMGYYGGAGGRQVSGLGPFKGVVQPDPPGKACKVM